MCENKTLSPRDIFLMNVDSPDFVILPGRTYSRGRLSRNVVYEISIDDWLTWKEKTFHFVCLEYMPGLEIALRLEGLCKSFKTIDDAKEWRDRLKRYPGLVIQERNKLADWRCEHGKSHVEHRSCWVKSLRRGEVIK